MTSRVVTLLACLSTAGTATRSYSSARQLDATLNASPLALCNGSSAVPGVPAVISSNHMLVQYEFERGLEGWASASMGPVGMAAEVWHDEGGLMRIRGIARGALDSPAGQAAYPWVDSPLGDWLVSDATYVVIRMKHLVAASEGVIWFRNTSIEEAARRDVRKAWTTSDVGAAAAAGGNVGLADTEDPDSGYWESRFPLTADGRWHTYAVPIIPQRYAYPTLTASFSQMRLFPAVQADPPSSASSSWSSASNQHALDGTVLVDWIRVATAPTILRVEGCSRISAQDMSEEFPELRPTDMIMPPVRMTVRKGYPLNQYYSSSDTALRRANFGIDRGIGMGSGAWSGSGSSNGSDTGSGSGCGAYVDENGGWRAMPDLMTPSNATTDNNTPTITPYASTYNCARAGGDVITIAGVHFGTATPRVFVNGRPCSDVRRLHAETVAECRIAPGSGVNLAVTVSNGKMPLLSDSKPYLSYQVGPGAPPRPVVTNVNARSVQVSWTCPQDHWQCMTVTGYIVQWRMAVLDDHTVGDTSNGRIETGTVSGIDGSSSGGGYIVTRPLGTSDPFSHPGSSEQAVYASAVQAGAVIGGQAAADAGLADAASYARVTASGGMSANNASGGAGAPSSPVASIVISGVTYVDTDGDGVPDTAVDASSSSAAASGSASAAGSNAANVDGQPPQSVKRPRGVYTRGVIQLQAVDGTSSWVPTYQAGVINGSDSSSSGNGTMIRLIAPDVAWGPWGSSSSSSTSSSSSARSTSAAASASGDGSLGGGSVVVTNLTSTTITGLQQGRRYQFRVAALSEVITSSSSSSSSSGSGSGSLSDDVDDSGGLNGGGASSDDGFDPACWTRSNLYGHRPPSQLTPQSQLSSSLCDGSVQGAWSPESEDVRTLTYDFLFTLFDANSTLDHGPVYRNSSVDALHWSGGEGHYGLILIGSAQIGNCNASHTCCDGFGGGVSYDEFLDMLRFLDPYPNEDTHAPVYRFDGDTMSYKPIPHAWSSDTDTFVGGSGWIEDFDAGTSDIDDGDDSTGDDTTEVTDFDAINTGTLPALMQSLNVGAYSAASHSNLDAAAGEVGATGKVPVVMQLQQRQQQNGGASGARIRSSAHESSLYTANVLLVQGLSGRHSGAGAFYSLTKEEPSVGWRHYDDAGALQFVPFALIDKLEADAAAADANSTSTSGGGGVGGGNGVFADPRVLPDEASRGPLPAAPASPGAGNASNGTSASNAGNSNTSAGGGRRRRAELEEAWQAQSSNVDAVKRRTPTAQSDEVPQQRRRTQSASGGAAAASSNSSSSASSGCNDTAASFGHGFNRKAGGARTSARVFRDRYGRRLVGLQNNPTSTCSLVCTAAGTYAQHSPVLNTFMQQSAVDGSVGGATSGSTSGGFVSASDIASVSAAAGAASDPASASSGNSQPLGTTASIDIDKAYSEASPLSRSIYGWAGVLGLSQRSFNSTSISANSDIEAGSGNETDDADASDDAGVGNETASGGGARTIDFRPYSLPITTDAPVAGRYSRALDTADPSILQPYPDTSFPSKTLVLNASMHPELASNATAPCGYVLRLTGSHGSQGGAAWYARPQQVREGFETTFLFRLSNPSVHCRDMNDVHTRCRSRGGHGFAFVIQTAHPAALGAGFAAAGGIGSGSGSGSGMGYEGIRSSVAVEFDTWADYDQLDPYENHVSVHTRGTGAGNSANHSYSLGHAPFDRIPDLTDGIHVVRISYHPRISYSRHVSHPAFVTTAHFTDFITNGQYPAGGQGQWGPGFGALSIYIDDDAVEPVLIVPLNLASLLGLDATHGRAWVGFSSATGVDVWQAHDILAWHFTQLRM